MNDTNNMWQECPTGELQEFVGRQAKRDRRRDITRRAAGGVLIAALVLIAVFVRLPSDQGHVIAGLSCRDVGKLAERYIARELDVATEGMSNCTSWNASVAANMSIDC